MTQAVPNLWISRNVFLKYEVIWNRDGGALQDQLWRNIWSADDPEEVYQCRRAFNIKQEAHLLWTRDRSRANWEDLNCCQLRAKET